MRWFLCLCLPVLLAACGRPSLDDPSLGGPKMDLEDFFAGEVVGYGQFQDLFGTARRRFTVEIEGTYEDETLTLVEDFVYEDGSTERRVWTLTKTGPDTWQGTAPGVIGTATGVERGDTFNWGYTIDLPIGDGETVRATFDDWMWRLTEDRVLNRAYMDRYGIEVGEVIIFFEKES